MRTIRLLPPLLALALAGCLLDSEKANLRETLVGDAFSSKEELAAKDDAVCRGYGAQPGTSAYVQCRVVQDQRRDADRNAARANAIAINNEPVRVGRSSPPIEYVAPADPMSVNERWFGTGAYLLQLMNRMRGEKAKSSAIARSILSPRRPLPRVAAAHRLPACSRLSALSP